MLRKLILFILLIMIGFFGLQMGNDFYSILEWWLVLFIIGLIFLPITTQICKKFFDKGYLFSKTIGLAIFSYFVWLFSALRLVPFSKASILMFGIILIISVFLFNRRKVNELISTLYIHKWTFVLEETLFLLGIFFWCWIRGMHPDIHGIEKFMDYGFVNSILRTRFMPPIDMWFAGKNINYYYFGHYICAFLTKFTGINPAVSYNLMLATLFSFIFSLTFSLAGNLVYLVENQKSNKVFIAGIISAFLLTFGGNLHTFIFAHVIPYMKQIGIYHYEVKSYWYPDATRYIGYNPPTDDKTIHEFPGYSLIVSDLHAHVLNVPFVLAFITLLLVIFHSSLVSHWKKDLDKWYQISVEFILAAVLLGLFYMINSWDFPIYFLFFICLLLYRNLAHYEVKKEALIATLVQGVKVYIVSLFIALPFSINFVNFSKGIGFVHSNTPFYQFLVLWGYQLFLVGSFLVNIGIRAKKFLRETSTGIIYKAKHILSKLPLTDSLILFFSIFAIGLTLIPEIIYVKDIYSAICYRSNTMFKFTYQAFLLFGLISGYIIVRIIEREKRILFKWVLGLFFGFIICMPMVYPFWAISQYYGFPKPANYRGIDGSAFLKDLYPGDFAAIQWLNQNVKEQLVILEADGDSYSDYGRISVATGLPTIQGWFVHEWLWRGEPDTSKERLEEVRTVYESDDILKIKKILKKYQVRFIIIGKLERSKFKNLKENQLLKMGQLVLNTPETKMIRINVTKL